MTNAIEPLRAHALDLFQTAVTAADPQKALSKGFRDCPFILRAGGKVHVIAVGKAAVPMTAQALEEIGREQIATILCVTNYENVPKTCDFPVHGAAHPLPDAAGLAAGHAVIDTLQQAVQPQDTVIVLLSGGGSALLPAPAGEISLAEKSQITDQLLKSGADIGQINTVRRALSALKGGGLAALCPDVPLYSYILSDVPGDHLADIASGPTVLGSTDYQAARALLDHYDLYKTAPATIKQVLDQDPEGMDRKHAVVNHLIGSNRLSVAAMAAALDGQGVETTRVSDWLDGPVEDAAEKFINILDQSLKKQPATLHAYICGGETAVMVTGTGRGGRNQEMALRVADLAHARGLSGDWVFLSVGTDGRDGPTDAAGGLVDPQTIARLQAKNLEVSKFLANNDSYAALEAAQDLIITGGTGTNVADVQVLLVAPQPSTALSS